MRPYKFLISLLILSGILLQGVVGLACDHRASGQEEETSSPCHQQASSSKSHDHHVSQGEPSKANCVMCQTGTCRMETPVVVPAAKDLAHSSFKEGSVAVHQNHLQILNRRWVGRQWLRPPPLVHFLPPLQNWQAFFSIFRN